MTRRRVVIAGLGDVGVLTAIRLAPHFEVVGISAKPGLVSGQELGVRLARPDDWARDYWIPFDRFRKLDRVRTVQAELTGVDLDARTVLGRGEDGATVAEPYDALVICTGVSNGFWRQPALQSSAEIGAGLYAAHEQLATAKSVIIVGGGAAAVSSAVNLATTWPDKQIELYFPGDRPLREYHPRTSPASRSPANRCAGAPVRHRRSPMPCCGRSAGCGPTPAGCHRNCSTSAGLSG
jgi:NADH dehydrogenase FAD-containing subunit